MPIRVLLLRHGETTHPGTYNGAESDVELSERGRRQTEALAPLVAERKPHVIVSSAMRRAVQTAQILLAGCKVPHRVEPDLHERYVGIFSGKTHEEVGPMWKEMVRRWTAGETEYSQEGAESLGAVRRRILPVWERLTNEYDGQNMVIVAHGNILKILQLTILADWDMSDWDRFGPIRNLAMTELYGSTATGWETVVLNQLDPAVLRACE